MEHDDDDGLMDYTAIDDGDDNDATAAQDAWIPPAPPPPPPSVDVRFLQEGRPQTLPEIANSSQPHAQAARDIVEGGVAQLAHTCLLIRYYFNATNGTPIPRSHGGNIHDLVRENQLHGVIS